MCEHQFLLPSQQVRCGIAGRIATPVATLNSRSLRMLGTLPVVEYTGLPTDTKPVALQYRIDAHHPHVCECTPHVFAWPRSTLSNRDGRHRSGLRHRAARSVAVRRPRGRVRAVRGVSDRCILLWWRCRILQHLAAPRLRRHRHAGPCTALGPSLARSRWNMAPPSARITHRMRCERACAHCAAASQNTSKTPLSDTAKTPRPAGGRRARGGPGANAPGCAYCGGPPCCCMTYCGAPPAACGGTPPAGMYCCGAGCMAAYCGAAAAYCCGCASASGGGWYMTYTRAADVDAAPRFETERFWHVAPTDRARQRSAPYRPVARLTRIRSYLAAERGSRGFVPTFAQSGALAQASRTNWPHGQQQQHQRHAPGPALPAAASQPW